MAPAPGASDYSLHEVCLDVLDMSSVSSTDSLPLGATHEDFFQMKCSGFRKRCKERGSPDRTSSMTRIFKDYNAESDVSPGTPIEKEMRCLEGRMIADSSLFRQLELQRKHVIDHYFHLLNEMERERTTSDNRRHQRRPGPSLHKSSLHKSQLRLSLEGISLSDLERRVHELERNLSTSESSRLRRRQVECEDDVAERNNALREALSGRPHQLMQLLNNTRSHQSRTDQRIRTVVQGLNATRVEAAWRGLMERRRLLFVWSQTYVQHLLETVRTDMIDTDAERRVMVRLRNRHIRKLRDKQRADHSGIFDYNERNALDKEIVHLQSDDSLREAVVIGLQAWWRGAVVRFVVIPGIFASRIQRAWRARQGRQQFVARLAERVAKDTSMAVLQKWIVGRARVKSFVHHRSRAVARLIAQRSGLLNLIPLRHAEIEKVQLMEDAEYRENCAIILQSHWRGHAARAHVVPWERAQAVSRIGALHRACVERRLVVIPRIAQQYSIKCSEAARLRALKPTRTGAKVLIKLRSKTIERLRKERSKTIFFVLQKGALTNKIAGLHSDLAVHASCALLIAAWWRGCRTRMGVLPSRAAVRIQAAWRAVTASRRVVQVFAAVYAENVCLAVIRHRVPASAQVRIIIQLRSRGFGQHGPVRKSQMSATDALLDILQIQKRDNSKQIVESPANSARARLACCNAAATILGAWWRGYLVRTAIVPGQQEKTALCLQASWRGSHVRRAVVVPFLAKAYVKHLAPMVWSTRLAPRRQAKTLVRLCLQTRAARRKLSLALIDPQLSIDGFMTAIGSPLNNEYDATKQYAATILQALWRGHLARGHIVRKTAATRLQATWRAYKERCRNPQRVARHLTGVCSIVWERISPHCRLKALLRMRSRQILVRESGFWDTSVRLVGWVQRDVVELRKAQRSTGATLLQAWWRRCVARGIVVPGRKLRMAIRIQTAWRALRDRDRALRKYAGYFARLLANHVQEHRIAPKVATKLCIRLRNSRIGRLRHHSRIQQLSSPAAGLLNPAVLACSLQDTLHAGLHAGFQMLSGHIAQLQQDPAYRCAGATLIQAWYRRCLVERPLRKKVVKIQAAWRAWREWHLCLSMVVQQYVKSTTAHICNDVFSQRAKLKILIRRYNRRLRSELSEGASLVTDAGLLGVFSRFTPFKGLEKPPVKVLLQNEVHQKSGSIILQSWWRGLLVRKRYEMMSIFKTF